jgi:hypothetical protein
MLAAVTGMVALAALAFAGAASTSAARVGARTSIGIRSLPGARGQRGYLYGYVQSARPNACAARRQVTLFQQRGPKQDPSRDRRVERLRAKRMAPRSQHGRAGYQWSTKSRGSGTYYVQATRTPLCAVAFSRSIRSLRSSGGFEQCGETAAVVCAFSSKDNPFLFNTLAVEFCPSFGRSSGDCDGTVYGPPKAWSGGASASGGNFHWNVWTGTLRGAAMYAANGAYLEGSVPNPASARYTIRDASTPGDPIHWCTPDIAAAEPGENGGPLYINFINKEIGATVTFWGYLVRKGSTPWC